MIHFIKVILRIFIEPSAIQQPISAVPAGRVTAEVSGATGARSTLKRKHSDPDPERGM